MLPTGAKPAVLKLALVIELALASGRSSSEAMPSFTRPVC